MLTVLLLCSNVERDRRDKGNLNIICFHELQELKPTRFWLFNYVYKVTERSEHFVSVSRKLFQLQRISWWTERNHLVPQTIYRLRRYFAYTDVVITALKYIHLYQKSCIFIALRKTKLEGKDDNRYKFLTATLLIKKQMRLTFPFYASFIFLIFRVLLRPRNCKHWL